MALPNSNISVAMVKAELGASTNDVGRLCIHPNVNKWSRWKPIRSNKVGEITKADLELANYGISMPTFRSIDDMVMVSPKWSYLPPQGGAASPYRLDDFRNYNKLAVPPLGGYTVTKRATTNGGNREMTGAILTANGTPYQLGFDDLSEGRKLAMTAIHALTLNQYTEVAENIGESMVTMDVRNKLMPTGTYNVYLYLTNKNGGLTNIVGLDNFPRFGLISEIVTEYVTVSVQARWLLGQNSIRVQVFATNTTNDTVTLLHCTGAIRFGYNECGAPYEQGERGLAPPSTIEVPPTGQFGAVIFERTVSINNEDSFSWKVCWSNGGMYPNDVAVNILTPMN